METVEITAGDLLLRPWQPGDAEAVHRACQDPVLHRWVSGLPWPYQLSDAAIFVGELAPLRLAEGAALHLGVFDKGELVGSVALNAINLTARTAGIGFWSAPWSRGRRVAERASRALLSWAFGDGLGLVRVDWQATIGNHASRVTALRLGFRIVGERPADGGGKIRWLASLVPGDLTAEDTNLSDPVRRTARTFGAPHPTLPAGALTLRQPHPGDVEALVATRSDPETARWFGVPQPYTEADARTHIDHNVPLRWARGAEAVFAIADGADAYIGSVDLRIRPGDPHVGEVGYVVSPWARGRGHAPAALEAICRWGFEALGLTRIEWRAEVGNDASRRAAEKAGFTVEGTLRQALEINGARRDCWVGSLVKGESA
ncbi:GNAT family N-acetyltransferase [Actinoplanes friuliensis]|uniref:GCN5-like N-acetyltransferase n=1 Tax=Actinoplanes friuliensis DSM 7358 TaxID=1246995 RepID=U5VR48_9ACTN|nr:GNAT family N-acetyltransferase [Actinoplanes friuliensis]AGZ39448.1 GCN5-like N-acetyltransferase [Actinoplanes friuliensis DSM 7358]